MKMMKSALMKKLQENIKYLIFFLFLFPIAFYYSCSNENKNYKVVPLNDLNNPYDLYVNQERLYITDCADEEQRCTSVLVYSLKDYSLLFILGGDGEEPGKFTMTPGHTVYVGFPPEKLFINDYTKIAFYTPDGHFINERETEEKSTMYRAAGNRFIAQDSLNEEGMLFYVVNIYNAELERIKEIYRIENPYNPKIKKSRVLTRELFFQSYKNNIYIKGSSEDFVIDVFNSEGARIKTIHQPYTREKVTDHIKNEVYKKYKNHPFYGKYYDMIKDEIVFPEYLPAIKNIRVADDKIYVLTYRREQNKSEFYILDMDGNILKKVLVPFEWQPAHYPRYSVINGKFYQLIKNTITNKWDLKITQLI